MTSLHGFLSGGRYTAYDQDVDHNDDNYGDDDQKEFGHLCDIMMSNIYQHMLECVSDFSAWLPFWRKVNCALLMYRRITTMTYI